MSTAQAARPRSAREYDTFDSKIHCGVLLVSRVADKTYDGDEFGRLWRAEGLDEGFLPAPPNSVHAFRNACRSVETRRAKDSGKRVEIKVDQAVRNGTECVYQLTRMVRDEQERVIEHEKELRVVYTAAKAQAGVDPIEVDRFHSSELDTTLRAIEARIRARYDFDKGRIPGAKVRELLRDMYQQAQGIPWAGGKVYFVPGDHVDLMERVARVIEQVCGEHADVELIPLGKGARSRAQLDKHGTRAINADAAALMAQVAERLKNGEQVKDQTMNGVLSERARLGAMRKRMEKLIGSETLAINEQLLLLDEQIDALLDKKGTK
jgi:hypothetical protein